MVRLNLPNVTALYNNLKLLASVGILITRGTKKVILFHIFGKFTGSLKETNFFLRDMQTKLKIINFD